MSYKISYGEKNQNNGLKLRFWKVYLALFIIGLAVTARICFPNEVDQLTEVLFPLTSDSSQNALEVFAQNIKSGGSFGDAVTAFCEEIINEAGVF